MFQVQVPIAGLPVHLILLSDGSLVFIKVGRVGVIFDMPDTGVQAIFDERGFSIDGVEYSYNTIYNYKMTPSMLTWLQQQNLIEPV
jgi:hypothetical protein